MGLLSTSEWSKKPHSAPQDIVEPNFIRPRNTSFDLGGQIPAQLVRPPQPIGRGGRAQTRPADLVTNWSKIAPTYRPEQGQLVKDNWSGTESPAVPDTWFIPPPEYSASAPTPTDQLAHHVPPSSPTGAPAVNAGRQTESE
jgi:hypothetical protein